MFKHIICTLFAKIGFFIVPTTTSASGSLLVRSVKKTSYCLKQVLHRNVLAGNQSNSFLLTHGDRRLNIHVHNYAIFSSKIRINVALQCYMQMYQWTLILRVSFSSSQSTCMPCVLHKHEKCIKSHFHAVYKMMDINVKSHANVSYVVFVSGLSKMAISRS